MLQKKKNSETLKTLKLKELGSFVTATLFNNGCKASGPHCIRHLPTRPQGACSKTQARKHAKATYLQCVLW